MTPYANSGGDSGVVSYSFTDSSITVRFAGGRARNYEYTDASAGPEAVTEMIRLAQSGQGLNSYISTNKPGYARKW